MAKRIGHAPMTTATSLDTSPGAPQKLIGMAIICQEKTTMAFVMTVIVPYLQDIVGNLYAQGNHLMFEVQMWT